MCSFFCCSVPWAINVGTTIETATEKAPTETSNLACSSLKIACCMPVPPRPPYSWGSVMPAHPSS